MSKKSENIIRLIKDIENSGLTIEKIILKRDYIGELEGKVPNYLLNPVSDQIEKNTLVKTITKKEKLEGDKDAQEKIVQGFFLNYASSRHWDLTIQLSEKVEEKVAKNINSRLLLMPAHETMGIMVEMAE